MSTPTQELEAFRTALSTANITDSALVPLVSKVCVMGSTPPTSDELVAKLKDAVILARTLLGTGLKAPSTAALGAPGAAPGFDRQALRALKRMDQTLKRLREDWPEHLNFQSDELLTVVAEAIAELDVEATGEKQGPQSLRYVPEESQLFELMLEKLVEAWFQRVEHLVEPRVSHRNRELPRRPRRRQSELPDLVLTLYSARKKQNLEYKVRPGVQTPGIAGANPMLLNQAAGLLTPVAQMLGGGVAAMAVRAGISAVGLGLELHESLSKRKSAEETLLRDKAKQELDKISPPRNFVSKSASVHSNVA